MAAHALTTPADAMEDDADAMSGTMQPMGQEGSGALASAGNFVSRTIYTASYAVSYGVVFPVMMVARVVPSDNVLVHGLADGAQAARERVFGWGEGSDETAESGRDDAESGEHEESGSSHGHRRRARSHRTGRRSSH
jgi:hypothetical protein